MSQRPALGRRQRDVLAAALTGRAETVRTDTGRVVVRGHQHSYPISVLDRLLELGLVCRGQPTVTGHRWHITQAGANILLGTTQTVEVEP